MANGIQRVIWPFIFILFSSTSIAQENCVHQYNAAASACFRNGEWENALLYYELYAENGGIHDAFDLLGQARSHLALNDTAMCVAMLAKGVERGLVWDDENRSLSIRHHFADDVLSWLTKERIEYDRKHQSFMSRLDQALIEQISAMVQRDQEVRLMGRNELSEREYKKRIHVTDSIHLAEVKRIFERFNGFPPDSVIERRTKIEMMLLVQHFIRGFPETFDYFADVVKQAISRFQIHPSEYAVMVDRRQYSIDGKSIYGEVPYINEAGKAVVDNVQNINEVDSLRFSIGLFSLKEHALFRGSALPENYLEQRSPCLLD